MSFILSRLHGKTYHAHTQCIWYYNAMFSGILMVLSHFLSTKPFVGAEKKCRHNSFYPKLVFSQQAIELSQESISKLVLTADLFTTFLAAFLSIMSGCHNCCHETEIAKDIFQTGVASYGKHGSQKPDTHCNWSDAQTSILLLLQCSCIHKHTALLLSVTHTHHLSLLCWFLFGVGGGAGGGGRSNRTTAGVYADFNQ